MTKTITQQNDFYPSHLTGVQRAQGAEAGSTKEAEA
jgi:hypothetical protein